LPVPLSPVTSTVVSVAATRRARAERRPSPPTEHDRALLGSGVLHLGLQAASLVFGVCAVPFGEMFTVERHGELAGDAGEHVDVGARSNSGLPRQMALSVRPSVSGTAGHVRPPFAVGRRPARDRCARCRVHGYRHDGVRLP
jgi:hypothetical protein